MGDFKDPLCPGPLPSQRIGTIDIGSNSVRFVMYELYGSAFTATYNEKVLAGLGRDLRTTGMLHPQGKIDAMAALKRFKFLVDSKDMSQTVIGATAALRDAKDAPEFIEDVRRETGFNIVPMSGQKEAITSAQGVIAGDPRARGIAADLGGASLELITVSEDLSGAGVSLPLGPFSVYEGAFDAQSIRPKVETILSSDKAAGFAAGQNLYLIGGAWRNLALIHQKRIRYSLRMAQNYQLSPSDAEDLAVWACGKGASELLSWPGVSSRRADTLPYAGLMLKALLDKLSPRAVIIAPGGLREGMVYGALPENIRGRDPLFDACRDLARGSQQTRNYGAPLMDFLSGIDETLPSGFQGAAKNRLRIAACALVGIGKGLHPDHRAQMVFETVLYAPMPGLTHAERACLALALFSSYSSASSTPNNAAMKALLSDEQRHAARTYGEAMRFAVVLSGRNSEILSHFRLSNESGVLTLHIENGFEDVLIERGRLRFQRLARLIGVKTNIVITPAD